MTRRHFTTALTGACAAGPAFSFAGGPAILREYAPSARSPTVRNISPKPVNGVFIPSDSKLPENVQIWSVCCPLVYFRIATALCFGGLLAVVLANYNSYHRELPPGLPKRPQS